MRVIGYVRVSTDDQVRDGHSLAQQPERLAAACTAFGHQLVDMIDEPDGTSGARPLERRQGGAQLLRRLKAGEAEGVMVIRLERLFRDMLDGLAFFRGFARRHGVQVVSLAEHIDTSTAAGRLALNIHLLMADAERDKVGERTREVMQGLRQNGRVFGHVPYGCLSVDGALFRDPGTWPVRDWISLQRSAGCSFQQIAAQLRRHQIPAPAGGRSWAKSTLQSLVRAHLSLSHLPMAAESAALAPPALELLRSLDLNGGADVRRAH